MRSKCVKRVKWADTGKLPASYVTVSEIKFLFPISLVDTCIALYVKQFEFTKLAGNCYSFSVILFQIISVVLTILRVSEAIIRYKMAFNTTLEYFEKLDERMKLYFHNLYKLHRRDLKWKRLIFTTK